MRTFDVAFTFAGPHRATLAPLAKRLSEHLGAERVLFDEQFKGELARPDGAATLLGWYKNSSVIVVGLSREYYSLPSDPGEYLRFTEREWNVVLSKLSERGGAALVYLLRMDQMESKRLPPGCEAGFWVDFAALDLDSHAKEILKRLGAPPPLLPPPPKSASPVVRLSLRTSERREASGLRLPQGRLLTARGWMGPAEPPDGSRELLVDGEPMRFSVLWSGPPRDDLVLLVREGPGDWGPALNAERLESAEATTPMQVVVEVGEEQRLTATLERPNQGSLNPAADPREARVTLPKEAPKHVDGAAVWSGDRLVGIAGGAGPGGSTPVAMVADLARDVRFTAFAGWPPKEVGARRLAHLRAEIQFALASAPEVRSKLARELACGEGELVDRLLQTTGVDAMLLFHREIRDAEGSGKGLEVLRALYDLLLPWCYDHRDPQRRMLALGSAEFELEASSSCIAEVAMAGRDERRCAFELSPSGREAVGRFAVQEPLEAGPKRSSHVPAEWILAAIGAQLGVASTASAVFGRLEVIRRFFSDAQRRGAQNREREFPVYLVLWDGEDRSIPGVVRRLEREAGYSEPLLPIVWLKRPPRDLVGESALYTTLTRLGGPAR